MGYKSKELVRKSLLKKFLCFYIIISIVFASFTIFTIFFVENVRADPGNDNYYVWKGVGSGGSGNYSDPFKYIQDAIENASDGDTIYVWEGIYNEAIELDVSVSLIGNPSGVILDGSSSGDCNGINITANYACIENFTIRNYNNGNIDRYGIYMFLQNNNTINKNHICNNTYGIYLQNSEYNNIISNHINNNTNGWGIYLQNSDNNTISTNQINNSNRGTYLINSNYNNISKNQIHDNNYGIYLENSNNNTINSSNQIYNNIVGIYTTTQSNDNNINTNEIYNNIDYGMYITDSNENTINGNQINSSTKGVYLTSNSNENTINGNQINDNTDYGLYITTSSNSNNITTNKIYNNTNYGIGIYNSNSNLIYNNNFTTSTNGQNAIDDYGGNFWNLLIPIEEMNIVGGNIKWGNYWSNYTGNDTTHDGIGDIWYNDSFRILNSNDTYPLVISPEITNRVPSSTTGVSTSPGIIVYFNKSMDTTTTEANFSLIKKSNLSSVSVSFGWSDINKTMYANASLSYETMYNATLSWNATDEDGNVMIYDYSWDFTTISEPPGGGGNPSPPNKAPIADAGGPYSGYVNSTITFTGSGADSDGTIAGYKWDFNNDGTYDTDWLTTNTTTHSYSSVGTYTVKLQVKDNGGLTGTDTAIVTISETPLIDNPPILSDLKHTPSKVTSRDNVTISSIVTDDHGITSVILYWNDGSDNTKSMPNVGGNTYATTIGPFTEGKIVTYCVEAIDTGQLSNNETGTFTVFAPPMTIPLENVSQGNETEVGVGSGTINRIKFKTGTTLENVSITIENLTEDEIAFKLYKGTGIVYQYLNMSITANGTYVTKFESLAINFTVNKIWFEENKNNISSIILWRFHNNEWNGTATNMTGENEAVYYYEAEVPGLSTFAVVGSKVVEKGETLEPEKPGIPWIFIIGFIIAGLAALIFILFKAKLIYVEIEEVDVPKKE